MLEELKRAVLAAGAYRARQVPGSAGDVTLVIQPDHLGDIVLSQPAVRVLHERFGDTLVTVVGPWSAEIARLAWPIDRIETFAFPDFDRGHRGGHLQRARALDVAAQFFAALHPVRAIVLRPDDVWSAAAAWAAGITDIVTGDDPRTSGYGTSVADASAHEHRAARAVAIACSAADIHTVHPTWDAFPLHIQLSAEDRRSTDTEGVPGRRYAVVHPGAGVPVKQWTAHRWRAVVRHLNQLGLAVVVTGGPDEEALCTAIASDLDAASLAGETTLGELCHVLADAAMVIGPDSGPLHLAVALGAPTVHLFGPSDEREFGPWGDPRTHRVVTAGWHCPRCRDLSPRRTEACGCMLAIPIDAVTSAIVEVLR